jgi:site-specific recombinase XerD
MIDGHLLDPFVRCFLMEDGVENRSLTRNTQRSYRDAIHLLLRYLQDRHAIDPARATVEDITAQVTHSFLTHLEQDRGNSVSTRNQRLKAIQALFQIIARQAPELRDHAAQIHALRPRRAAAPALAYLDKAEIETLLAVPDRRTAQGRRDYALLLFLYNTGAHASEVAELTLGSITLDSPGSVRFNGRRGKSRVCPLWPHTSEILRELLGDRIEGPPDSLVFHNVRGQPITRFGIHTLVARIAAKAVELMPSMRAKRVSPHTIRHTTAVHFLRSGIDIDTVGTWLGHLTPETMHRYAELDRDGDRDSDGPLAVDHSVIAIQAPLSVTLAPGDVEHRSAW